MKKKNKKLNQALLDESEGEVGHSDLELGKSTNKKV